MAKGLETDLLDTWNQFRQLATDEIVNSVKRGMRRSAREIKKATVENARAGIRSYNNHNGEYDNGNILDAVRVTGIEDRYDEDVMTIKVHVLGYRQPPNKTFRFRFLEKGTRHSGKMRIKPRRFFGQANSAVNVQQIYLEEIQKGIDNANR